MKGGRDVYALKGGRDVYALKGGRDVAATVVALRYLCPEDRQLSVPYVSPSGIAAKSITPATVQAA